MPIDYSDNRKLILVLESKKQFGIIFSSVKLRIYFESAVYTQIVSQ